jgi:predicted nuclease of restriction endonuclease-like (RecB) superfamily
MNFEKKETKSIQKKQTLDALRPKFEMTMISYKETNDLLEDTCEIVESAQRAAYTAVDTILVQRNWLLGKRIAHDCLDEDGKADYGKKTLKKLSADLNKKYGKGFDFSNLYKYVKFYRCFPEILDAVRPKSGRPLSWTHYRILLQETSTEARKWYEKEAQEQEWSYRTLQRNISSQYYYRMLKSQNSESVETEMKTITAPYQLDKLEFIKNPVIAEFLGLESNTDFTETELEQRIITHIQKFLMEMGKGYAFVARQQHIRTEKEDYYIDLVFYNYILKCFVLIDLKTTKITHQDVGQMDMYIRMYDELKRNEGDNPTLGIILCADTDEDIAKYSILHGHEQLFASKYKTYLPSEEQLREEIEIQKQFYYLQKKEEEGDA